MLAVLLRERLALASLFEGFCLRFAPDRHRVCAALAALDAHQIHAGPITFCAISPSCSHSTVHRLSTHTAAVRAMHGCTRKYTQYQSVGIGGNVNADVRQHSRHEAPWAPCRYTDAPVSILIAPGAFLARVLFYCKRKNLLRNSTRLELFRVFSGLVPLLADIAHTLSYTHPSLVPVIHPSASHHTSPWNPSILTWEFNITLRVTFTYLVHPLGLIA